ncbi:Seven in absentia protein family [Popillia japonica]|uniref:Seven in absentia protein family n=1 Tax=Popillia japonica TaxID=7064 RepID=A0AAW1KPN4_POPJA
MPEHKRRCRYRPYKCFFCEGSGVWNGPLNTFEESLRNSHDKYWLNKFTWRNNSVSLDCYKDIEGYCVVSGNIFYFHQYWSNSNEEIYYDIKHINYGHNGKSYTYEIKIHSGPTEIKDRCIEDDSVSRIKNERGCCLMLRRKRNDSQGTSNEILTIKEI